MMSMCRCEDSAGAMGLTGAAPGGGTGAAAMLGCSSIDGEPSASLGAAGRDSFNLSGLLTPSPVSADLATSGVAAGLLSRSFTELAFASACSREPFWYLGFFC